MTKTGKGWALAFGALAMLAAPVVEAQADEAASSGNEASADPTEASQPSGATSDDGPPNGDEMRIMIFFAVGGGGDAVLDVNPPSPTLGSGVRVDNNATVGAGIRLEVPLFAYLSVGFQADLLSYATQVTNRDIGGHFDLWLKTRYYDQIKPGIAQEYYLGIPVGFTVQSIATNPALERDGASLGWNIGVLLGYQVFVGRYGSLLEMGWRRVDVNNEESTTGSELNTVTNQFHLNVGYLVLF